jgi:hypothetical protein
LITATPLAGLSVPAFSAYRNVAVFDFYNVLTTNGGNPDLNDHPKSRSSRRCC